MSLQKSDQSFSEQLHPISLRVNPKKIVPPWFQICMPFLTVVLLNEIDNFTIHLYTLFYSVHPIHTPE
eukprot:Em0006g1096a